MAATKTKAKKPNKAKTKKPNKAKTKKPTKKPNKAKTRKPAKKNKPTTGQSAPKVEIAYEDFNDKEVKILKKLNGSGKGKRDEVKIADLAKAFSNKVPAAQRNSWTRNSLRRLTTGHPPGSKPDNTWVEKIDRGLYQISETGRRSLRTATKKK
jgi:hypothetical protein